MKVEQLGRHILAEFYNCDSDILNDHKLIEKYMTEAAEVANATVVTSNFHMFNPWGVSGVVVIQESHLTIHTWPEYGYASIDLFTCGDEVNPWLSFEYLKEKLKAEKTETEEVSRGLVDRIRKHSNNKHQDIKFKVSV
ncbi:S-adenosylmethionine decarboxylase related [Alkaliphilus metalliredigens QYMF]|uniref:S-adenosylmethionine decarboxylase proenzyme n=1 Tax=Alkaliphilus metalliredigens (strain QYMF) TaxID=293826 RepID=A6TRI2_ALKMQ|nr:adenosylmethionine decarboxylase [Alkaliphilus metalliredigens]ABR48800.1 S-adenosylmethionine decarboxylase related [Alkaliphilus metalliredigens QYMF]